MKYLIFLSLTFNCCLFQSKNNEESGSKSNWVMSSMLTYNADSSFSLGIKNEYIKNTDLIVRSIEYESKDTLRVSNYEYDGRFRKTKKITISDTNIYSSLYVYNDDDSKKIIYLKNDDTTRIAIYKYNENKRMALKEESGGGSKSYTTYFYLNNKRLDSSYYNDTLVAIDSNLYSTYPELIRMVHVDLKDDELSYEIDFDLDINGFGKMSEKKLDGRKMSETIYSQNLNKEITEDIRFIDNKIDVIFKNVITYDENENPVIWEFYKNDLLETYSIAEFKKLEKCKNCNE